MAGAFRFMLGFYPKTEAIEAKHQNLQTEFNKVKAIELSEELARYVYLKQYISSPEYLERKRALQTLNYKGSEEHLKEQEYLGLKKVNDIKFYYKFKNSKELAEYQNVGKSSELAEYKALKAFVQSDAYKAVYDYLNDKKRFEKTPEYKKLKEYESIKGNSAFINFFKFISSSNYENFKSVQQSSDLLKYRELESYIQSDKYNQAKSGKDFKKTEAYSKLQEFDKLKNSPNFRTYFKLLNYPLFNDYKKINKSAELTHFLDLQKVVESEAFKAKKRDIESQKFENTEEYKKLQKLKSLENSSLIKKYFKTHQSKQLAHYKQLEISKEIAQYEELQKYILSQEFTERKNYLLDPKKWEKTEDFSLNKEYEQLNKSAALLWYFKCKDLPKYKELRNWNLVFEDHFDKGKLDKDKWITRYFWGEMLMGESYALPGEKHFFTDSNVEMNGTAVKLITRQNKVTGKEWNPTLGFYPKNFDFTSGLISTGKSYRQKYGRVEAKVKIPQSQGIIHAFWLSGNTILPQIDIFKYSNQKLYFNTFWANSDGNNGPNKDIASISAASFTKGYFIYSLEWTPNKLVWKINNIVVKEQTVGVPEDDLYLVLNSGKYDEAGINAPSTMEIDWVRCYERSN